MAMEHHQMDTAMATVTAAAVPMAEAVEEEQQEDMAEEIRCQIWALDYRHKLGVRGHIISFYLTDC